MSQITIEISFDEEKLNALDFSLQKENTSAQMRLEQALAELYEKAVPDALREYVDSKSAPAAKRPAKQTRAKPAPVKKPETATSLPVKEADRHGG